MAREKSVRYINLLRLFRADLKMLRQLVEKEFVYNIILYNMQSTYDLDKYRDILDITLLPNACLIIQVDGTEKDLANQMVISNMRKQVWRRLRRLLEVENDGIIAILGSNNISMAMVGNREVAVLLPVKAKKEREFRRDVKDYARFLKAYLEHHLAFTVSLGIGNQSSDLWNLHQAYREAKAAVKNKFYLGNSSLIYYGDVQAPREVNIPFFIERETALVKEMRNGQWENLKKEMDTLFHLVQELYQVDPDILKVRVLEMFTVLSRTAMDLGVESKLLLDLKVRIGTEIEGISILAEMVAWTVSLLDQIINYIKDKHQDTASKAVARAKQYLGEKFYGGISLDEVARQVHLSPSYFSHIFRELTGSSFSDYLKQLRITAAQRLLLSTQKNVAEIGQAVGYGDPNYFSRVFKNVVGQSPNDYRTGKKA